MASGNSKRLPESFDSVVMLTWSDWKTEPRANRYHYATRFARHLPVFFVQPDSRSQEFFYEDTQIPNLSVLHVSQYYDLNQIGVLSRALRERQVVSPLLWAYNPFFGDFVAQCFSELKIYHATEDYFSPFFAREGGERIMPCLRDLLKHVDLVVAVSEGVAQSYRTIGGYSGPLLVLQNGCDFQFWRDGAADEPIDERSSSRVALYQGGINSRLDVGLIAELLDRLPNWEFRFCGPVDPRFREWTGLARRANLKYMGNLSPEELRRLAREATVALIPFQQSDWIVERSLPLKAFEYAACGLPVVSIPIRALEPFPRAFRFASDARAFGAAIEEVAQTRADPREVAARLEVAASQDYDRRFAELMEYIAQSKYANEGPDERLNILVLYDPGSTHVATISDHLSSFRSFSRHHIYYVMATGGARGDVPLTLFDVVVIHYSIRVSLVDHLSPGFASALRACPALKVLFIQDEYDTTETARQWIESLGIHAVFTCVSDRFRGDVYSRSRFPHVRFVPTLTGYVPPSLEQRLACKPPAERSVLIGYRGRDLPFWYGNLGREKLLIGQRMREICERRGLPVDIEWTSDKRIYGSKWFEFLAGCKATLGTESGANVFDDEGKIRRKIEEALIQNPDLSYDEAFEKYLEPHEGRVVMNQVSPKIFEAIALRTALVLFEGDYSGVIKSHEHYIPLRKDFSNVDQVLALLQDDDHLRKLTDRAYRDVIESRRYSYRAFIEGFDRFVTSCVARHNSVTLFAPVSAYWTLAQRRWVRVATGTEGAAEASNTVLSIADVESMRIVSRTPPWARLLSATRLVWGSFPAVARRRLKPAIAWILRKLRIELA